MQLHLRFDGEHDEIVLSLLRRGARAMRRGGEQQGAQGGFVQRNDDYVDPNGGSDDHRAHELAHLLGGKLWPSVAARARRPRSKRSVGSSRSMPTATADPKWTVRMLRSGH